MKRPALQNKQVRVLGMAFQARKVFGISEKRAPGLTYLEEINLSGWVNPWEEGSYRSILVMRD